MRTFLVSLVSMAALFLGPTLAENSRQDVAVKATHVAGSVYMLEGAGGNIGVSAGPDGIFMVDAQFAPLADKIRGALRDLGQGELKFVVNTHYHGDHVGGNTVFGEDAIVIAHTNVRKRVKTPQEVLGRTTGPLEETGWPVITFDQSLSVHFNGEEIKLIHFASGHTDGDAMVYFSGSNVLHMGDHLFSGMFPFVDLEAGGTVEGFLDNLKKVIEIVPGDAKVIPGHGPLSTMDDVKKMITMIEGTVDHVRSQMGDGKELEEIKKAGLPEQWAPFDWYFITTDFWIETIYNSYSD